MKLSDLSIGQRFEFQGKTYVKTGPIAASDENTGAQRMIPRWAVLMPLGEVARPAKRASPAKVRREDVVAAFQVFCQECESIVAELPGDEGMKRLGVARQRFLDSF